MLPRYHAEITRRAIRDLFSAAALEKIVRANLYQDRLTAQIGHDEFHFDNNAFEKSYDYIEEQRRLTIMALESKNARAAWAAFGRLTHTAQDFYAHSNYIDLWLANQSNGALPAPSEVDPVDLTVIANRALRSARIYLPLEPLSFIRVLRPFVMPLLPRDSHAWMNLDSPESGSNFQFAFQAAIKRTQLEFKKTISGLSTELRAFFVNQYRYP